MTLVAVAGALANKPANGGEAWVRMSWVTGLRRLGLDVLFVEQASAEVAAAGAAWFGSVVERFGLDGWAALVDDRGATVRGLPDGELRDRLDAAELLVNISGHLGDGDLRRLPRSRA